MRGLGRPWCFPARLAARARARGAFTLIELLVVIAVIMLLAALTMPAIRSGLRQAELANCRSNLKQIGAALMIYATNSDSRYPPAGRSYRYNVSEQGGGKCNVGHLYPDYLDDGHILYCPGMGGIFTYDNPDYGFVKFPDDYCVMAYIYACHAAAGHSLLRSHQAPRQAMLSDNVIRYLSGDWGCGHYMHVTGYNVLHADGGVDWYQDLDESIAWSKIHSNTSRLLEVWDAFSADAPD